METKGLSRSPSPSSRSQSVSLTPPRLIEQFEFNFSSNGATKKLKVPLPIPIPGCVSEFTERLITFHKLPIYVRDDLIEKMEAFQRQILTQRADEAAEMALDKSDEFLEERVEQWADLFKNENAFYSEEVEASDELNFAAAYHSLIHSPALGTLLKLEHTYALAMQQENEKKEMALTKLESKHEEAMQKTLGMSHTDQHITNLASSHVQEVEAVNAQWHQAIDQLRKTQRRGYREFVVSVQEEQKKNDSDEILSVSTPTMMSDVIGDVQETNWQEETTGNMPADSNRYEESFTIYLGTQLKTEHNLRLLCCDVLDLCRHKVPAGSVPSGTPDPQRLQTAMSLYSNSLSGLVLLVDNRISSYSGIKKAFATVCQQSTDFHFPSLDQQLEKIREDVKKGKEQQEEQRKAIAEELDEEEIPDVMFDLPASPTRKASLQDGPLLSPGDYYITKHSNLAEVHVVFHLAIEDSVLQPNMSSRHRCLNGLRSIIHVSARNGVKTLTVPLLLVYEMSEEMTVTWCLRRAELVLKCVKGYMIECSTWAGNESLTIQFLVPHDISQDLIDQFSAMVSNLFHLSNTLKLYGKPRSRTYSAYT